MIDVVDRARRYLAKLPPAIDGSGGHSATFHAACVLVHGFDFGEADALSLLSEWNVTHCEPSWSEKELLHKVKSALGKSSDKGRGYLLKGNETRGPVKKSGVAAEPKRKDEIIAPYEPGRLVNLVKGMPVITKEFFIERSPIDPRKVGPGRFLETVFEDKEKALVFTDMRSQGDFGWVTGWGGVRLSKDRGVKPVASKLPTDGGKNGLWFLNQPVDGEWRQNAQGKWSRRSTPNVTRWAHMVIESDYAPEHLWLKFLGRTQVRIKAIYSSGGRSWHALVDFPCGSLAQAESNFKAARGILPRFGADGRALTPMRLTRLPNCTRDGRLQELIYLNPEPAEEPIIERKRERTL